METINYKENIEKALQQEQKRLYSLKKYKAVDQDDWDDKEEDILKSETRIKLLEELLEPVKESYHL
jgi:cob(I)alamin adenosyltransferase